MTTGEEKPSVQPSPVGANGGRDQATGKFLPGNKCGRGAPLAGQVAKLRAAMVKAVKVGDVKGIIAAMVSKAKAGDVAAAKMVLQYTLGEPQPFDILQRIETLEAAREGWKT